MLLFEQSLPWQQQLLLMLSLDSWPKTFHQSLPRHGLKMDWMDGNGAVLADAILTDVLTTCDKKSTASLNRKRNLQALGQRLGLGQGCFASETSQQALIFLAHFPMRTCSNIHSHKLVDSGTIMVSNQAIRIYQDWHVIGCKRVRNSFMVHYEPASEVITRPSAARARTAILEYFEANPDAQFSRTLRHYVHVMRQEYGSNGKYRERYTMPG